MRPHRTSFPRTLILALLLVADLAAAQEVEKRYRLRGVVGRTAAVEDTQSGRQIRVRIGQELDGWIVEAVAQTSITLASGDRKITLELIAETPRPATPGG